MTSFPAWWPAKTSETTKPNQAAGLWAYLQTTLDVKQSKPAQTEGVVFKEAALMMDSAHRNRHHGNPNHLVKTRSI